MAQLDRSPNHARYCSPRIEHDEYYYYHRDEEYLPRMTANMSKREKQKTESPRRIKVATTRRSNSPQKKPFRNQTDEYYHQVYGRDDYIFKHNDDYYHYYAQENEHYDYTPQTKTIKVSSSNKGTTNRRIKTTIITSSMQNQNQSMNHRQKIDSSDDTEQIGSSDDTEPMFFDCENIKKDLEHGLFQCRRACLLGAANLIDWNDDQYNYSSNSKTYAANSNNHTTRFNNYASNPNNYAANSNKNARYSNNYTMNSKYYATPR
jgi:hypothetical protein